MTNVTNFMGFFMASISGLFIEDHITERLDRLLSSLSGIWSFIKINITIKLQLLLNFILWKSSPFTGLIRNIRDIFMKDQRMWSSMKMPLINKNFKKMYLHFQQQSVKGRLKKVIFITLGSDPSPLRK